MPDSAVGTVVQSAWSLILVELGVGIDVVNLKGGVHTELLTANKGFPLVSCAPALFPQ